MSGRNFLPGRGAAVFSVTIAVALLAAAPASGQTDDCLVGTWEPDGNGAIEWMRRNMPPGMALPMADIAGRMTFAADGSYSANASGTAATMTPAPGGSVGAQARMRTEASGRWSAADGTLVLSPESEALSGQMQVTGPDGMPHGMAMPSPGPAQPTRYQYSCAGPEMETRLHFPGMADPMVQRYRRAGAN